MSTYAPAGGGSRPISAPMTTRTFPLAATMPWYASSSSLSVQPPNITSAPSAKMTSFSGSLCALSHSKNRCGLVNKPFQVWLTPRFLKNLPGTPGMGILTRSERVSTVMISISPLAVSFAAAYPCSCRLTPCTADAARTFGLAPPACLRPPSPAESAPPRRAVRSSAAAKAAPGAMACLGGRAALNGVLWHTVLDWQEPAWAKMA
mmetsp:Transcript_45812/g.123550  ORF Transcript_45812/g.123550 Transcript_45812/m.123550 type:complete len:205 (+) Transcript_45812:688-1302(+)